MKDDASPAIRKLRAELQGLNETTKDTRQIAKLNSEIARLRRETAAFSATPGMKAAEQWFRSSTGAASTFVTAGGGVAGVLGTIGLGALGAAGSMAAMVSGIKNAGDHMLDANEKARQFGVSLDYLLKFESTGKDLGLSIETMDRALAGMAAQLPQLKAGVGPLKDFLTSQGWPDLAEKLRTEDTAHALDDILHQLDKIRNPAVRSQVLGGILGAPELEGIYGRGGYAGFVDRFSKQKTPAVDSGFIEQMRQLRDAQNQFNQEMEKFETTIGPPFLKTMTALVELGTKGVELFSHPKELLPKVGKLSPDEAEKVRKGREDFDKNVGWNPLNWFRFGKKTSFEGGSTGGGGLLNLASLTSPGSLGGDPVDMLAAGTKRGFLGAYLEIVGMARAEKAEKGGVPDIVSASFTDGGGGFRAGTGGRTASGGPPSGPAGPAPSGGPLVDTGSDGIIGGPGFNTRGVRNKNIGNIGWGKWAREHGATGSSGTDTGHGVAVFPSFAAGAAAASALALEKYSGGKKTIDALIAGQHGWTPGNHGAAANIARSMGLSPFADAHLDSADMMEKFKRGLAAQELGPNGAKYAFQKMGAGAIGATGLRTLSEECVALAKAAVGANSSVTTWRKGVSALDGTLKPGTPVATFMDSLGRASNRYAGGGTGTRGANRDHAGIFQDYIRDGNGKIIGMHMAEQYKGSHGVHSKAYFNRGYGEGNASNYNAIMGPDGQPLGGNRNPMARRAIGLPNPAAAAAAAARQSSHVHLEIEHPHDNRVKVRGSSGPISTSFKSRFWPRHDYLMTGA